MRLRPLNDVLIVKHDPIEKYDGLVILPEKNTIEKISQFATVISFGKKCSYPFKVGQRIVVDRFRDKPMKFILDGEEYRFIYESYVIGVCE